MNLGDLNKVWEIKTLKRKEDEAKARDILERIAKQVQPIMRNHNWRVKLLSEFCPKNPALLGLNVNHGVHVKLRLRRPNRDNEFYPFHQVLDTMLHELCHNAHGPHNALFYKLWDDLRKECEELMSRGVTGSAEGFDLPGRRLGGFSRQPAISSLRNTAIAAAQKRQRLGSLLPSGPKRLGGDSSMMAALTPGQAAAMAAERRLQDEIWCASGHAEVEEGESSNDLLQKHVNQGAGNSRSSRVPDGHKTNAISRKSNCASSSSSLSTSNSMEPSLVDLTTDSLVSGSTHNEDSLSRKRNYRTEKLSNLVNGHQSSNFVDLSDNVCSVSVSSDDTHDTEESTTWECVTCTLLNPPSAPICDACCTPKPKGIKDKFKFWHCKFCTLENSVNLDKCIACGQWRYSHGAPVAAPAPNIGT